MFKKVPWRCKFLNLPFVLGGRPCGNCNDSHADRSQRRLALGKITSSIGSLVVELCGAKVRFYINALFVDDVFIFSLDVKKEEDTYR